MGKIEGLATIYGRQIGVPWQRTIAGAQRVVLVVYDKDLERTLRVRKAEFEQRTRKAGHDWVEFDCSRCFGAWMARDDYRDAYFEQPEDLGMKLNSEFLSEVAAALRDVLQASDENTVVAVTGIAQLYGFLRVSELIRAVEADIQGRLVIFFPGSKDGDNYRLLDAQNGWNYLANSITLHGTGSAA